VGGTTAQRWYATGDWNAFFGLALDNLAQLVILSSVLIGVFGFPSELVLHAMVPGTAAGVLVGDLFSLTAAERGVVLALVGRERDAARVGRRLWDRRRAPAAHGRPAGTWRLTGEGTRC
jgi:hypothetical protein